MNKDLMFSSKTDLWETPQDFLINWIPSFDLRQTFVLCQKMQNASNFIHLTMMLCKSHGQGRAG